MKPTALKSLILFSLLFFAVITATAGILGALEAETVQSNVEYPLQPESLEVFLPETTEIDSAVFRNFRPPLTGKITSPYGYRTDPFTGEKSFHRGVDIGVKEGSEIAAVASGKVKTSAYSQLGGNYIILSHKNGTESYYGHLKTRLVSKGDSVEQGEPIGLSGATGKVTGAHLHFQLSFNGRTVDPQRYLDLAS